MKIQLLFKWYDFWIGLYWDRKNKWLYVLPIPMCGVVLKFRWVVFHKCHHGCVENYCVVDCNFHKPIVKGLLK